MTARTEVLEAAQRRWPDQEFRVKKRRRWVLECIFGFIQPRRFVVESAPTLDALLAKVKEQ